MGAFSQCQCCWHPGSFPGSKVYGAHLRPTGPRWAPCWSHEPCYLGSFVKPSATMALTMWNEMVLVFQGEWYEHAASFQYWWIFQKKDIYRKGQLIEAERLIYTEVNQDILSSNSSLSPLWCQAIIWTNTGLFSIGPMETNVKKLNQNSNHFSQNNKFQNDLVCKMILAQLQCAENKNGFNVHQPVWTYMVE